MRMIIGRVPKQFLAGLLLGALLAAYGWVGANDFEQEVADTHMYCNNVDQGVWRKRSGMHCPKAAKVLPGERLVAM